MVDHHGVMLEGRAVAPRPEFLQRSGEDKSVYSFNQALITSLGGGVDATNVRFLVRESSRNTWTEIVKVTCSHVGGRTLQGENKVTRVDVSRIVRIDKDIGERRGCVPDVLGSWQQPEKLHEKMVDPSPLLVPGPFLWV